MSHELWAAHTVSVIAMCLWREARNQKEEAIIAVACCIRNRVEKPSWWGRDYLDVVSKKWQFSSITDPKDPQLILYPKKNDKEFTLCLQIADNLLQGQYTHPAPGADSYYDESIQPPKWAVGNTTRFRGKIGAFYFYDLDNDYEARVVEPKQT